MSVAILGTGNIGAGLASALAAANHDVAIGARDPAQAAAPPAQIPGRRRKPFHKPCRLDWRQAPGA